MTPSDYVQILMRDERERIISEVPTIFEDDRIERVYEIDDGAIVKYEWQSPEAGGGFNHRFTLVKPPSENPAELKPSVLETIPHP